MTVQKYHKTPYHLWNPDTDMDAFLEFLGVGPTVIVRGEGAYVFNDHGKRFINGTSSVWNVAVGHGRQELVTAAAEQMTALAFSGCWFQTHPRAMELAAKLVEITPRQYQRVYLGTNGTEAIETALKLVRQYHRQSTAPSDHGRYKIISLRGSYHGHSYGSLSTSGLTHDEEKFGPLVPGFAQIDPPYCYRCPFHQESYPACGLACAQALESTIQSEGPETVAGFILEPIMGDFSVVGPPDEYYHIVGDICRRYGLLFIADEVTTGFGRAGKLFVSEDWDPQPDILCLGKGISSGYLPLSAMLTTEAVYKRFLGAENSFVHGSTHSGHPVCAAVGLANIDIILRENLPANAARVGAHLKAGLETLMAERPIIGDVRGKGLMIGIELVKDRVTKEPLSDTETFDIVLNCTALGLIVSYRTNALRLLPPLIIDEGIADEIVSIIRQATDRRVLNQLAVKSRLVPELARSRLDRV